MSDPDVFTFDLARGVEALNAGLFVSRGKGRHPDRVIDSHELIVVRRGRLGMREERRSFALFAGHALHLRPGRRHFGTEPYPPDLSFYWIHFRVPAEKRRGASGGGGAARIKIGGGELLRVPQHAVLQRPERAVELFHRFLDDQETGRLRPLSGALLVLLLLCETAERGAPPKAHSAGIALAGRADRWVAEHFHENVGTTQVAAALDCCADYLGRAYRAAYGWTLTEAIHRRRIQEARSLLREGRLNVDEIARECGFSDVVYFRRLFRRYAGLTPTAFRNLHTRMHVVAR